MHAATEAVGIWRSAMLAMRRCWRPLFSIHLVFSLLGLALFTPLTGLLIRLLLYLNGQPAIADQDIAWFFLSPFGAFSLLLVSALLISILALEQSAFILLRAGEHAGASVSARKAIRTTLGLTPRIMSLALRLVVRLLLLSAPFLILTAASLWLLISEYDINYYLARTPAEFILAALVAATILAAMAAILTRKLLDWALILPLVLFTEIRPADAFHRSQRLVRGHKRSMLYLLALWSAGALLLTGMALLVIHTLGNWTVPRFNSSLSVLLPVLALLILLWLLANFLVTSFTSGSFAFITGTLYTRLHGPVRQSSFETLEATGTSRLARLAAMPGAVVFATVLAAVTIGYWLVSGIQVRDDLVVVAHRGAAGAAPENTLAAVEKAIEDGADWIEIDVQETADGHVVVVHDSDLMKLAGVDMKIWEATREQLQEVDVGSWFSPQFADQRVPGLSDVLDTAHGKARVVIELKYYGHDQQLEQRVVELVESHAMAADVAIMSLKYEGVAKIRALRPDWTVGLLSATAIGRLSGLDADFLAVNQGMARPSFIRDARQAGKQVFVWTVNDPVSMSRMMTLGVDGIITDEPAMAREVLAERAGMGSVERLLLHTAVLFGRHPPPRLYRDDQP